MNLYRGILELATDYGVEFVDLGDIYAYSYSEAYSIFEGHAYQYDPDFISLTVQTVFIAD